MDDNLKKILDENLSLNKDNNLMLKKLVEYQKWRVIFRIFYWLVIILSSFGAYYFIQPYLGNLISLYTGGANITNIGDFTKNIGSNNDITDLLKSLNSN